MIRNSILFFFCSFFYLHANAADTARVLFIGNSYTAVNNLPQIVEDMAIADGNVLIQNSNTPGGYTFKQHSTNSTTLSLIAQGDWDYVVLQEQSQSPSFPDSQVEADVLPFAAALDSIIHSFNPCTKTLFYMTWGRKNGDAANCPNFPPICTYEGMDSLLRLRYTIMAEENEAYISPVGPLWRVLRQDHPTIELYSQDESHPSAAGSFAAAASFYSVIFNKDPEAINYNYSLDPATAQTIRSAAKTVVFDSLAYWSRFVEVPVADFDFSALANGVFEFQNQSEDADTYLWSFGDGDTSVLENPSHQYTAPGIYNVCLEVKDSCNADIICKDVEVSIVGINQIDKTHTAIYPNPVLNDLNIQAEPLNAEYHIFGIHGKEVNSGKLQNQTKIDCSELPDGLYFLQIIHADKTIDYLKFVKSSR